MKATQMLHNGNQSLWLDNITRGMEMRGASAPLKELQRKFGFEPDRVVAAAKELLERA